MPFSVAHLCEMDVFRLRESNMVQAIFAYSGLLKQARLKGVLMAQDLE